MGRDNWTPERLTPRDVVVDRDVVVSVNCSGCRFIVELNVWTVGARLADVPFQIMRFRCRRCGAYAASIEVGRRDMAQGETLFTIPLTPRCWDERHDANQKAAMNRLRRANSQATATLDR